MISELIDANKEVTSNYQAVKKNNDSKQKEFEEILIELEEVKNSLSASHKQKKAVQAELSAANKTNGELRDKIRSLESTVIKKEKEINDAITKLNDVISDYEAKLEMKEEQIWMMGTQINECNLQE
jgi:septal ring factor EnvC (AmiA/AmiB activator)